MSKRRPTSQLNHDNWNAEEDDIEEPGHFTIASNDEIRKRVIKKAKRTMSSDTGSPFAGFSAFKSTSKPAFSTFSFTAVDKKETNSVSETSIGKFMSNSKSTFSNSKILPKPKDTSSSTKPDLSDFSFVSRCSEVSDEKKLDGGNSSTKTGFPFKTDQETGISLNLQNREENDNESGSAKSSDENKAEYSDTYYECLKTLNENFLSWIQKHLEESKYCIFTPGFADYEKYLNDLEKKYKNVKIPAGAKSTSTSSTGSFGFNFTPSSASPKSSTSIDKSVEKSIFSFSANSNTVSNGNAASGFSFKEAAANAASKVSSEDQKQEEEEYRPPENDFKEVTEDKAFYTQKCKLFYKKFESFAEKGKGNLFLKRADDKTQLIIRADTNLGNILLNIILNKSMPVSRMGKNNVMIACVPNPALDTKEDSKEPIPMLIRVKTSEDADKLLENIESSK